MGSHWLVIGELREDLLRRRGWKPTSASSTSHHCGAVSRQFGERATVGGSLDDRYLKILLIVYKLHKLQFSLVISRAISLHPTSRHNKLPSLLTTKQFAAIGQLIGHPHANPNGHHDRGIWVGIVAFGSGVAALAPYCKGTSFTRAEATVPTPDRKGSNFRSRLDSTTFDVFHEEGF